MHITYMKAEYPALASRVRLQIDPVTGAPVLLYPEGLLELNETAHEVVKRCDGRSTTSEIATSLGREYEVKPDEIERDVFECVDDLVRRNLIILRR